MAVQTHENFSVLEQLDLQNLDNCANIFSENFVWHYFNTKLSDLEGDYRGVEGLKAFFAKLANTSDGSFESNLVDAHPIGDELMLTQVCNRITIEGEKMEFDAAVIWRVVNGKISEAWDIPAINSVRPLS